MTDARPLLIAGATGYGVWPANTLEGARRCLRAPVDGIEIDVQLTADGQVVAHHDWRPSPDQARLGGAWIEAPGPPIKRLTLAEARRYDVGRSRPGSDDAVRHPAREAVDGAVMPTLPELLEALTAAPGPRRLFYVEVKTHPTRPDEASSPADITQAVLRDLEAADYLEHAKIIAFDWQVLRLVRDRHSAMMTAHLTVPAPITERVKPGPDGRSPWVDGFAAAEHGGSELAAIKAHGGMEWSPYYTDVTPERMAEAAALRLRVGPWGLSQADDIRRMAALGVYSSTVSGPDWG